MTASAAHPPPETIVTLTFEVADSSVPIRAVNEMRDCHFTLEAVVPRDDDSYATYYSVRGGDPDRIVELATEHETCEAKLLDHRETERLLELTVTDDSPLLVLAAGGAIPRQLIVENGEKTLTVEVSPEYDVNEIIDRFARRYPDAKLTARKQQSHGTPVFSDRGFERMFRELLTDRQREALHTAYDEGYYEWPRTTTGEKLAEQLGITASTFHEHLRQAGKKLVQRAMVQPG